MLDGGCKVASEGDSGTAVPQFAPKSLLFQLRKGVDASYDVSTFAHVCKWEAMLKHRGNRLAVLQLHYED